MVYELNTKVTKEGLIIQTLLQDKVETLTRWVCSTREVAIKDALIKLGWTPPKEEL